MDESCTILLLDRLKFIVLDNELLLSLITLIFVQMVTEVVECGGGVWGVLAAPAKKLTTDNLVFGKSNQWLSLHWKPIKSTNAIQLDYIKQSEI